MWLGVGQDGGGEGELEEKKELEAMKRDLMNINSV